MVERMKPILPHLTYPKQGTFIGGQNIFANVMIIHEFMYDLWRVLGHLNLMAIKLDM